MMAKRTFHENTLRCVLLLLGVLIVSRLSAAPITFADANFNPADWVAFELIDTTPGQTFELTASQTLTGGNPASYHAIEQRSSNRLGSPIQIMSAHIYARDSYTPASAGAIASVSFSYDGISFNSSAGAVAYGPLIRQASTTYFLFGGPALNNLGWKSFSFSDLTAENFSAVVANSFDQAGHPDFGVAGTALEFGFGAFNGTFGESVNLGGVDNWQVSITAAPASVPLPIPLFLLLSAAATVLKIRRPGR